MGSTGQILTVVDLPWLMAVANEKEIGYRQGCLELDDIYSRACLLERSTSPIGG
jgi:hypothetical protein